MGAHQNVIQRAVVVGVTVVSALSYGAFDALVCILVQVDLPPFFEIKLIM